QLFPGQPTPQRIGLLIGAFLPANLYLAHHITNETWSGLFVTAALYFCLRIIRSEKTTITLCVGLGVALGLALLTKFSAVLAVPIVLVAVAWKEFRLITSAPTGGGRILTPPSRSADFSPQQRANATRPQENPERLKVWALLRT